MKATPLTRVLHTMGVENRLRLLRQALMSIGLPVACYSLTCEALTINNVPDDELVQKAIDLHRKYMD